MGKCKICGKKISNPKHDYCYDCWCELDEDDDNTCLMCGKELDNPEHEYCYSCYKKIEAFCDYCDEPILKKDKDWNLIELYDGTILCSECCNRYDYEEDDDEDDDEAIIIDTRDKYPCNFRSKDGHRVRSRGEILIDNFFYDSNIRHIYEKPIVDPITGDRCTCDWYLEDFDIYVEFWGIENSDRYDYSREYKTKIYKNAKLNLIDIEPEDVDKNLDLLKYRLIKKNKTLF